MGLVLSGVQAFREVGGIVVGHLADVEIEPVEFDRPVDSETVEPGVWQVGVHGAHIGPSDIAPVASVWAGGVLLLVAAGRVAVRAAVNAGRHQDLVSVGRTFIGLASASGRLHERVAR